MTELVYESRIKEDTSLKIVSESKTSLRPERAQEFVQNEDTFFGEDMTFWALNV